MPKFLDAPQWYYSSSSGLITGVGAERVGQLTFRNGYYDTESTTNPYSASLFLCRNTTDTTQSSYLGQIGYISDGTNDYYAIYLGDSSTSGTFEVWQLFVPRA